jgi:hypothetical protein
MIKTRPALFKWRHFETEIIVCAVRWYLRFSLSYRGVIIRDTSFQEQFLDVPTRDARGNSPPRDASPRSPRSDRGGFEGFEIPATAALPSIARAATALRSPPASRINMGSPFDRDGRRPRRDAARLPVVS